MRLEGTHKHTHFTTVLNLGPLQHEENIFRFTAVHHDFCIHSHGQLHVSHCKGRGVFPNLIKYLMVTLYTVFLHLAYIRVLSTFMKASFKEIKSFTLCNVIRVCQFM